MALQHLRSSTTNKRPDPTAMADGQLAINTPAVSPGLFFKDAAGALVKVGPVHVGTTAPNASPASGGTAGNSVGEQWLDTTGGAYVFKVWDGSAWRSESGTFVDVNGDVMTGALGIIAGSASAPGLYISGDANTGLYSPGSDQLAMATGGTGRLFVNASGQVGVGTSSPTVTLDVANIHGINNSITRPFRIRNYGQLSATGYGVGMSFLYPNGTTSDLGFEAAAIDSSYTADGNFGNLIFSTNNNAGVAERLRITSSGNVGIGTTSPVALLQVGTGNTGATTAKVVVNTNNVAGPGLIVSNWTGTGTTNGPRISFDNSTWGSFEIGGGNSTHSFVIRDTLAASDRFTIDSSGRLLVGTSSAVSSAGHTPRFMVSGTDFNTSTALVLNTANDSTGGYLHLGKARGANAVQNADTLGQIHFTGLNTSGALLNAGWISCQQDGGTVSTTSMPGRLVFSTTADGASAPTERMRIKSTGTINFSNVATYADNTAALAGGLVAGDVYRKSDGTLMITY